MLESRVRRQVMGKDFSLFFCLFSFFFFYFLRAFISFSFLCFIFRIPKLNKGNMSRHILLDLWISALKLMTRWLNNNGTSKGFFDQTYRCASSLPILRHTIDFFKTLPSILQVSFLSGLPFLEFCFPSLFPSIILNIQFLTYL